MNRIVPYATGEAMNRTTHNTACQRPKSNTSWSFTVAISVGMVSASTPKQRPREPAQSSRSAANPNTTADAT
jgi:hypothetical protein